MPGKTVAFKHSAILATYLLIVWGLYRLFIKLPDEIEELFIKPIVWLVPVFILVGKEKLGLASIGLTLKNIFPSIYLSLGLGSLFLLEAVILNYIKYKGLNFGANIGGALLPSLGISFITAFSEEVSFRGYIFARVWYALNNEWLANLLTSFVWTLLHLPIVIFVWHYDFSSAATYLFLTALFSLGSAFLFARTKNVASSILLHLFWEWPIILFR